MRFIPEGGRVGVTVTAIDGGAITVAVSDTGIGIAPEDQAAIFEESRQVGREDARKQEGTGLGLTLAKKFVELHGGRIWVESHVGQGSTFTFTRLRGHDVSCQAQNPEDARCREECGACLAIACPQYRAEATPDKSLCRSCGTVLPGGKAAASAVIRPVIVPSK